MTQQTEIPRVSAENFLPLQRGTLTGSSPLPKRQGFCQTSIQTAGNPSGLRGDFLKTARTSESIEP